MSNDTQVQAIMALLNRFENQVHRMGELWNQCQGKGWPEKESDEFAQLRDVKVPATRAAVEASARQLAEQGARDKQHRDLFFAAYHLLDGVCEDHPALADVLNVDAHGALCHALAQLDSFYGVNGTEDVAAHFQVEPGSRLEYELHVLESRTRAKGVDPRDLLETALARIEDMLADDDGQAFKEARKFLESARQLAEQPGFVMVPVGEMAEIKEALDICVSLLESAKSNHLPRIIAAYSKAAAIVKAETCDCPAKDMPFGRCCKASAPTAVEPDDQRYQLLRRGQHWSVIDGVGDVLRGDDLDAAVDSILAARLTKDTP